MIGSKKIKEMFREKIRTGPSEIEINQRGPFVWACRFAIETIEDLESIEICKWKAWDHDSWTTSCGKTWVHDIEHDHPNEYIKYCPVCGKIAEIETYTEDEDK